VKTVFKTNLSFLLPYILFLISGAFLIFANSKSETHLEFNHHHNNFFDYFFYYATNIGDGITATIVIIALLFIRFRFAIIVGLSFIISAIITQTLKHTLFSDVVRPKKYFEGIKEIYLLPNVENHLYNSFPSGHATCAFALFFSLAMISKNKIVEFSCFAAAMIAAYSRIYLSQHFFEDIYAGSLIGTLTALFVFIIINKKNNSWFENSILTKKIKIN
jgi:membrane-associated phospholipid phosphatase